MKKIFITGGAGFIGSHISEEIFYSFKKSNIIIFDKLTYAGSKSYIKKMYILTFYLQDQIIIIRINLELYQKIMD